MNVTVIDGAGGAPQKAVTVLTRGKDIVEIGRNISVPVGAIRVDATSKFLIPGLWDMHAHHQGTGAQSVDLFIANGVVGTRDMGADVDFILPLRDRMTEHVLYVVARANRPRGAASRLRGASRGSAG